MPRKEINDYTFYKIVCLDEDLDLCYVGSTSNWKMRGHSHKHHCYNENSKKYNTKLYITIRENGGWDNFKMIQLGQEKQLTLREAEAIEEEYRQQNNANMNGKRCFITEEQKKELWKSNYDKNGYKKLEKVECECGIVVCRTHLPKHKKSDRHLELINTN